MRFHVPQFIEKESKIIGPLTLRQFLWFLGGATIFVVAQFIVKGSTLIIVGIVIFILTMAMAYGKINGVSLPKYMLMGVNFFISSKKYVFIKEQDKNSYQKLSDGK